MHTIKSTISDSEYKDLNDIKRKLAKTQTIIIREALQDYINKIAKLEQGFEITFKRNNKRRK